MGVTREGSFLRLLSEVFRGGGFGKNGLQGRGGGGVGERIES